MTAYDVRTRSPDEALERRLAVTLVEFNPSGGLFQFAVQLGEALARRGHRVELLTGPRPELASRVPGFTVVPALPTWHASDGAADPAAWRRVRRVWRAARYHAAWGVLLLHAARRRPDVLQLAGSRFPTDGLLTAVLTAVLARTSRRAGRRSALLTVAHAPQPFNEQRATGEVFKTGPVLHRALDLGYRSCDAVLVLGEQTAADLRAAFPGVRRVAVVPHGDEDVFLQDAPSGAASTGPVVLCFGTMQAYKGLDLLLDAFPLVRAQRPDARLVMSGAPSGDTDVDALRRRAEQVGGVEFRPGYVPLADVDPLFRRARLVVAPYRYANASGVVELAHTFARPVVATAVGDLPAAVRHEVAGLVVPPGDAAALAAAMVRLLDDPAEAQRLGEAGRAAATTGWAGAAEEFERVYLSCLGSAGAGP